MGEANINGRKGNGLVRFSCKSCGQKIRVSAAHTGKKGRCPRCKSTLIVPQPEPPQVANEPELTLEKSQFEDKNPPLPSGNINLEPFLQPVRKTPPDNVTLSKEQQIQRLLEIASMEPEPLPQRKLPWPIDVFLYPSSKPGFLFLGVVVLALFAIEVSMLLFGIIAGFFWPFVFLSRIVITLYVYWYLLQCVKDSALGGIRAPETIGESPGLGEMFGAFGRTIVCAGLCAAPAIFYFYYRRAIGIDAAFWILVGAGAFYYPMAILAVTMFDSFTGLSPSIVLPSICSVFIQYCGLLLVSGAMIWLLAQINRAPLFGAFLLIPFRRMFSLYVLMVAGHLLGRFYFRYQDKLNWEV